FLFFFSQSFGHHLDLHSFPTRRFPIYLIADSISPPLVPNVEIMTHEGKNVLMVETFPSSARPHYLKNEGHEQGVYVRLGSSNRQDRKSTRLNSSYVKISYAVFCLKKKK